MIDKPKPVCAICRGRGFILFNHGHTTNPDGSLSGRGIESLPCPEGCRELESVPVHLLRIADHHHSADGHEPKSFVRQIVDNFDPQLLGDLTVSMRSPTDYVIIDGASRFLALRELKHATVSCEVLRGLTEREEAEKYLEINTRRRVFPVSARQTALDAAVAAEDVRAASEPRSPDAS